MHDPAILELRQLEKTFSGVRVLSHVNLTIRRGELAFIIGRSGQGKSVLLRLMVGLLTPDAGEIYFDGRRVDGLSEVEWYEVRRRCAMVFQFPALLDRMHLFDNVAFGPRCHGWEAGSEALEAWVFEQLRAVGIPEPIAYKFPNQLSFTQQKRVSLARALALKPDVLLLDEPTTGLDPVSTDSLHELMKDLKRTRQVSFVVVSHDLKAAMRVADRIILIEKGEIVHDGDRDSTRASSHPLVRRFIESSQSHKGIHDSIS